MDNLSLGPQEQVVWPAAVLAGIAVCVVVYDLTRQVSSWCFKGYDGLNEIQKIEWNNRGISTFHALVTAGVSFYLLVLSDLFSGDARGAIIDRKSGLSDGVFGVSLGYFLTDLAMILWYFPRLGGKEYLLHHGVAMYSLCFGLLTSKAHFYILLFLITEATTPFVNLRWYLDLAGQKASKLYLYNGLAMFVGWLVARVILFVYIFAHIYLHFDQVMKVATVFPIGLYIILAVGPVLSLMNLIWFWKICKGMVKALSKTKQSVSAKTD